MLKIERIDAPEFSNTRFRMKPENGMDYCYYILTIFGRTWRITYSSKFNYFYMVRQIRRERLMIDALSQSYLRQLI
ncbi:MAG: hypothetical protein IKL39_01360, partial [Mailhella sp.]|nr:hypothetical protein [Mailhella sp.]